MAENRTLIRKRIGSRLSLPRIVLLGDLQCCVENYETLIAYTPEQVRITAAGGQIVVDGQDLVLFSFTEDRIDITGKIVQVRYEI